MVEGKLEDKRRAKHIVLGARSHVEQRPRPSNERDNLLRAVTAVDITVEPPPEETSFRIRRPSTKRPGTAWTGSDRASLSRAGSDRSIDNTGRVSGEGPHAWGWDRGPSTRGQETEGHGHSQGIVRTA